MSTGELTPNIYASVDTEGFDGNPYLANIFNTLNKVTANYVPKDPGNLVEQEHYQVRASALRAFTISMLWGRLGDKAIANARSEGISTQPVRALLDRYVDSSSLANAQNRYAQLLSQAKVDDMEKLPLVYKTDLKETSWLIGDLNIAIAYIERTVQFLENAQPGEGTLINLTINPKAMRDFQRTIKQGVNAKTRLIPNTLIYTAYGLQLFFAQVWPGFEDDCKAISDALDTPFTAARRIVNNSRHKTPRRPHI